MYLLAPKRNRKVCGYEKLPQVLPVLRFGVCRSSDLSIHVQAILLHKRIVSAFSRSHDSSSNDRFSPHAGCVLHGKQHFRNTATLGSLPRCLLTAEAASFRVRDSHPIPLFSEQECVSDCSGRAFATKAMLFSLLYAHLILRTQKDLSCSAKCQTKEALIFYKL